MQSTELSSRCSSVVVTCYLLFSKLELFFPSLVEVVRLFSMVVETLNSIRLEVEKTTP